LHLFFLQRYIFLRFFGKEKIIILFFHSFVPYLFKKNMSKSKVKLIEQQLCALFEAWSNEKASACIQLAQSGSDRVYYRIKGASKSCIGTHSPDKKENTAFITFTQHFWSKGLPVPEIYRIDNEKDIYIQQDLGDTALYQLLPAAHQAFTEDLVHLYKKILKLLALLQIKGGEGLDYSVCYPRQAFDHQSMLWDLHYFKNYFLKLAKIPFDEQALEDDFEQLIAFLLQADCSHFLCRDFQSRNIMIHNGEPYFIDYQGGRKGALQYDVASLLFQAKGNIPHNIREDLLDYYLDCVELQLRIDRKLFTKYYYGYVLIRCLQAMGAYGFRGLYERKEHFIASIPYAIKNVAWWLDNVQIPVELPVLRECLRYMVESKQFEPFDKRKGAASPLVVKITSFSYKKSGIPLDDTGNGGGFVLDCRAIENPGRYEEYKKLTGRDKPVIDFLKQQKSMDDFLLHTFALVDNAVENYIERDFEHLCVHFGCTGGQHRSVYAAEALAKHLKNKYDVKVDLTHIQQEANGWVN
jgi:aminoglycoside/choline kinase family phosphotransferase